MVLTVITNICSDTREMGGFMKNVANTFNYIYKVHCLLQNEKKPEEVDMELIKILSKYIVIEPNYYEVMQKAYKFYKKYNTSHELLQLEDCVIEASKIFEDTGRSELFGELSDYFINKFISQFK